MNIRGRRKEEAGSALFVILIMGGIMGIVIGSALTLTSNQVQASMRSEYYHALMPIAEAGIEEGLTQVNRSTAMTDDRWISYPTGLTLGSGKVLVGQQYVKNRILNKATLTVAVSGDSSPSIVSQASISPTFAKNPLYRTVIVTTSGGGLFTKGLIAKTSLTWVGKIVSDSFDSQDPNYSTGGRYDATKTKANGSVGAVQGNMSLGGGTIYGMAYTGPSGAVTGGTVGDAAWVAGGHSGVQSGHYQNNLNVSFPEVAAPWAGGASPPIGGTVSTTNITATSVALQSITYPATSATTPTTSSVTSAIYPTGTLLPVSASVSTKGKVSTTNYTYTVYNYTTNAYSSVVTSSYYNYILDNGNYQLNYIANGETILVRGTAKLYVLGAIAMKGNSQITIATTGALTMYVGGACDLSGNGVLNNTANPLKFSLYGLPTCTSIKFNGNASFTGSIYAPDASFSAGGGGNTVYDCVGSIIVHDVFMNGHFNFHYDESLGKNGPRNMFMATSWNEI